MAACFSGCDCEGMCACQIDQDRKITESNSACCVFLYNNSVPVLCVDAICVVSSKIIAVLCGIKGYYAGLLRVQKHLLSKKAGCTLNGSTVQILW